MNKPKSVFIGGAFSESQYLWVLSIIFSYCRANNIKQIILESTVQNKVLTNKIINKNIRNFNIIIFKKKNIFHICKFFLFDFLNFLKKKNSKWFNIQISHSIVDTSRILAKKDTDRISLIDYIKAYLIIFSQYSFTKQLLNKYDLSSVFLGHSVYQYRVSLALLRELKINIYCQANNCLYKISKNNDNKWDFFNYNQINDISKLIKKSDVTSYWKKRIKGKSNYEDYNNAFKKNKFKLTEKKINVVTLHVFKDSPFNFIDKNKIFLDYFEWFTKTIEIINKSDQKWFLKIHPSAKRWGENSKKVIESILKSNKIKLNKNVLIDDKLANSYYFENLNKLVTFSGTTGIEAIAHGVKPITISRLTSENSLLKNYYLQPKNNKQYETLLNSNNQSLFNIKNKKVIYEAQKLIFIRENVITLNTNFKSKYIYRGDSQKYKDAQYKKMEVDLKNNYKFLFDIGKRLRFNQNFYSKEYFYKKYNV